ncbi:MAG: hypothetical protein RL015_465 [Verrucomicrobiota bacterium]|jgi:hypothetical protein
MSEELEITNVYLNEMGDLHALISGQAFWAGEKYTFLEMGWAVYCAEGELPEAWLREHGETRPAEEGWDELASRHGMLVTSHPVLVALSLRAWWHRNGREIPTAPAVKMPTFAEAVEEVRGREILNDSNLRHAGTVPGLRRWQPPQPRDPSKTKCLKPSRPTRKA